MVGHYLSFSVNNDIDPRLLERGFTEAQIKEMRNSMGSNAVVSLNLEFRRDLRDLRHPNFNFIYTIYDAWREHNALPFPGSYTEQPNKIIEHFTTLDALKYESERKAHAKAQRDANKKKR